MERLIDADKLIELIDDDIAALDKNMPREGHDVCLCTLKMVKQYIEALSTIEAVPLEDYRSMEQTVHKLTQAIAETEPIKHGRWIPCTKSGMPLTEFGRKQGEKWYGYKCSECNDIYKGNALLESPWCRKCGAKMDGEENG